MNALGSIRCLSGWQLKRSCSRRARATQRSGSFWIGLTTPGSLLKLTDRVGILVHPFLWSTAELSGNVAVLGYLQYLEVWELDKFKARIDSQPFTDDDAASLAELGI